MKKILILTDFSQAALKALQVAQQLFAGVEADFYLLHAFPLEPDAIGETAFLAQEAEQSAFRNLERLHARIQENGIAAQHRFHLQTAPGSPVQAVKTMLEQDSFDLVVAGATGGGFFPVLGSVATGLIRHARTHVLVVPEQAPLRPVREVVLATDYRELSQLPGLPLLNNLKAFSKARLTALSIIDAQAPLPIGADFERYRQQLAHLFETVETSSFFILDENVAHGIGLYLDNNPVDLLVTVPHRKTMQDVLWNRSLTRRLAYRPRVPLLALYAPEPATVETEAAETISLPQG